MSYQSQLDFLTRFYRKCNLQMMQMDPLLPMDHNIDYRFRESLRRNDEYFSAIERTILEIAPRTIYRVTDQYLCCYLFLAFVSDGVPTLIASGPYLPR